MIADLMKPPHLTLLRSTLLPLYPLRYFVYVLCALTAGFGVPTSARADVEETRRTLEALAERVTVHRLDNGLRVILYRRGYAPVFAGAVGVRVGGSDETPGQTGISHLLEHMAFKGTSTIGTKDYPRERRLLAELEKMVEQAGADGALPEELRARWGAVQQELEQVWVTEQFTREYENRGASGMNATTDTELTRYFVNLPRSAFEFWALMESERILDPVMRQFYQERDVVMEERRMRYEDRPEGKLYERLLGAAFLVHPYQNPVIGYDFDIRRLTATEVDEFRRRYYVPGNIAVSVVGDVDPARDLPILERYFGRIPTAPVPKRPSIVEPVQEGEREFRLESNSSPELFIAYRKPQYPHPDDPAISVFLQLVAGSRISPLYTELVKRRQLAADIGHTEVPGSAYPNLALFTATVKSPHTNDQLIEAFDEVLDRFCTRPVSESELEIAKRAIAVEHLEHIRSNMSLALDFVSSELLYNDWKAFLDWYNKVMLVTAADVQRVGQSWFNRSGRTVARLETKRGVAAAPPAGEGV